MLWTISSTNVKGIKSSLVSFSSMPPDRIIFFYSSLYTIWSGSTWKLKLSLWLKQKMGTYSFFIFLYFFRVNCYILPFKHALKLLSIFTSEIVLKMHYYEVWYLPVHNFWNDWSDDVWTCCIHDSPDMQYILEVKKSALGDLVWITIIVCMWPLLIEV